MNRCIKNSEEQKSELTTASRWHPLAKKAENFANSVGKVLKNITLLELRVPISWQDTLFSDNNGYFTIVQEAKLNSRKFIFATKFGWLQKPKTSGFHAAKKLFQTGRDNFNDQSVQDDNKCRFNHVRRKIK